MTAYSVANAKDTLPRLIDRALKGEEVVITRHGKPMVELRPVPPKPLAKTGTYDWLRTRRRSRPSAGLTSIEILDRLYETEER